jgi:hypothetical protein
MLGRGGVLLVGDAVGLAYTQSGEVIRPAVESGIYKPGGKLFSHFKAGIPLIVQFR